MIKANQSINFTTQVMEVVEESYETNAGEWACKGRKTVETTTQGRKAKKEMDRKEGLGESRVRLLRFKGDS